MNTPTAPRTKAPNKNQTAYIFNDACPYSLSQPLPPTHTHLPQVKRPTATSIACCRPFTSPPSGASPPPPPAPGQQPHRLRPPQQSPGRRVRPTPPPLLPLRKSIRGAVQFSREEIEGVLFQIARHRRVNAVAQSLSSEEGTHKPVRSGIRTWLWPFSGERQSSCSLFARQQPTDAV